MTKKNIKEYAGSEAWLEEYKRYIGLADEKDKRFAELSQDIAYDMEKFKDPLVVGALIYRLIQERMKTNELFRQILDELKKTNKLLQKEGASASIPITSKSQSKPPLSDVDEKIVEFIKEKGTATADEVQKRFGYKGRNAASARLSRLYQLGILVRNRAGRKVYYSTGGRS